MRFKKGDIVRVVDFSEDYPNTPLYVLEPNHPYRKLGDGECEVLYTSTSTHTYVTLKNKKNGMRNSIYSWRCVLVSTLEPDWEV